MELRCHGDSRNFTPFITCTGDLHESVRGPEQDEMMKEQDEMCGKGGRPDREHLRSLRLRLQATDYTLLKVFCLVFCSQ